MADLFQLKAYLRHWLTVVDHHSVHSPFFFDFYTKVIQSPGQNGFEQIESLRTHILNHEDEINFSDLGAGSKVLKGPKLKLADIAKFSVTPPRYAQLYHHIIQYTGARNIVELGTSLGLTSLYLAHQANVQLTTFEGSHALADVALSNFEYCNKKNISLIEGDIKNTLPEFLQSPAKIGFVLMDANHKQEPTLQYFEWLMRRLDEKSVVVVDDIHWSAEMEQAWNTLKNHPIVYSSIDLFRCGILFFEPGLNRQHFVWSL